MGKTSIEWVRSPDGSPGHTINPIRYESAGVGHYCEMVSPGCANCYASALQWRFGTPRFGGQWKQIGAGDLLPGRVFLDESKLAEVARRKKPTAWFWADMTDLFGWWVPDAWLDACFATMAITPQHVHLVLTKRAARLLQYSESRAARGGWPLSNVWLGVSVENQRTADERLPEIARTPAAVRFVSAEPLLGPIDFNVWLYDLDWIIAGGESGANARPCNTRWIREILLQCRQQATVSPFVKQLGSRSQDPASGSFDWENEVWALPLSDSKGGNPAEWPEDLQVREWPEAMGAPTGV